MADNVQKQETNTMMWWIIFFIATAITILMLIYVNEWFWLALPFSLTSLAKAFDVI